MIATSRTLMILLGAGLAGCTSVPAQVGTVDIEQAYQRSPLVLASAGRLNAEFAATSRDLKRRGRALAELRQQLEFEAADLDTDVRAGLEARYASDAASLAKSQSEYREELAAAQEREAELMVDMVTGVAREVAEREGLTLLLDKQAVLYVRNDTIRPRDITELVIRALLERSNPTQVPDTSER